MSEKIVLLVTHSGDFFTIDKVIQALSVRGICHFRFDTDKYPLDVRLSAQFSASSISYKLQRGDNTINSEDVCSVWTRRLWEPAFDQEMPQVFRESCIKESRATLSGLWDSLRHAKWIDKLENIYVAENKQLQLRIAREVGFTIPQTLITNDAEQAREFFQQVNKKAVMKLLTALSRSMEHTGYFFYTKTVKEEDLANAESLRYCPMVFQQAIPKQLELRVVFVQGQIFTGALDASAYGQSTEDWRSLGGESPWQHHELPTAIIGRIKTFMHSLGLSYGALDFIVTPDGEYVFLEVNPQGEWGMLERDLELPIANALAEALIA